MARPTVIRNGDLLIAARSVFLERGILATSAEVALRAGVSEGTLFKRFKTKSELFRAAMGIDIESVPDAIAELPSKVGMGTVRENMVDGGLAFVGFFERVMPFMMMVWSNPLYNRRRGHDPIPDGFDVPDPLPIRAQRLVATYLEGEILRERIRAIDPKVIARAYLGAMSSYVFTEILVSRQGGPTIDRGVYVRDVVEALWGGMRPGPVQITD